MLLNVVAIPVLVVDDMDDMRTLVRFVVELANEGLQMAGEASSGMEALDMVDEVDPAVIVLDELMPGLRGMETAERILARRPGQPIILFSAYVNDDMQEAALRLGVKKCVSKADYLQLPEVIRAAAA